MEEDYKIFIKIGISTIISLSYCYYFSTRIKSGLLRLLSVLPVSALFFVFPLFLSSVHLTGYIAFLLSWLANLKLILFAFDKSPLFPLPSNLLQFICSICFPINPNQNPNSQNHLPKWVFAIKVAILHVLLYVYQCQCQCYIQNLPQIVLSGLYSLHIYLELEILFILLKVLIFFILDDDLKPQSNAPYLATSLQDFWSRRWNLTVPEILRPGVYFPVRRILERYINSDSAKFLGILTSFFVSGLAHEMILVYVTREMPTLEITCFFVLHGVCTAAEIVVKKKMLLRWRWRVFPAVSRLFTVAFVVVTGGWLLFPPLVRCGLIERLSKESLVNDLGGLMRSTLLFDIL